MSQLVVSVAGAAVGFAIGGPAGAKWGWMAGSMLGAAFAPNQKAEGPRLEDLSVSSSAYGSVIPYLEGHMRMGGQVIWASPKREIATTEEQGGKGGGGTDVTTYTYEVDMHVLLTDCEIFDVTRIWVNGKLIYSMKDGNTPGTTEASDNTNAWARMTVYTGAPDQMPDPDGHPDAPAYRGRGSVFFKSYGLGQSGAMPNLTFEVTRKGVKTEGLIYNAPYTNEIRSYNTVAGTLLDTVVDPDTDHTYGQAITRAPSGKFWASGYIDDAILSEVDFAAGTVLQTIDFPDSYAFCPTVDPSETYVYTILGANLGEIWRVDIAAGTTASWYNLHNGTSSYTDTMVMNAAGTVLAVCITSASSSFVEFIDVATATQIALVDVSAYGPIDCHSMIWNHDETKIYVSLKSVVVINAVTHTIETSFDIPDTTYGSPILPHQNPGGLAFNQAGTVLYVGSHIFGSVYSFSVPGYTLLTSYVAGATDTNWSQKLQMSADYTKIWVYCWSNYALTQFDIAANEPNTFFVDLEGNEEMPWIETSGGLTQITEPTLREVVERQCAIAGLSPSQYDASALSAITQPVHGMAISQVSTVRNVLEQLASAYFFECRLSDKLYFTPRATTTVGQISYIDMAASDSIGGDNDPLPLTQTNELEIPSQMALTYICEANDYQTDTQYSDRLISGQENTSANQLPLNFSASEAKAIVDSLLLDKAISALQTSFNVNRSYSKYEVNDVLTLVDRDSEVYTMRVVTKKESDGIITFRAVKDDVTILTQSGTTTAPDNAQTEVLAVGATQFTVLDVNLFFDAANESGLFVAVDSVESEGWTGATVYRSTNDVTFDNVRSTTSHTVIGTIDAQPPVFTGGDVVDYTNTVTVDVGAHNTLSSITRTRLLEDETANAAVVGHEIIQFQTATLVSPGVYVLGNLLRGRRGTEYMMGYSFMNNRFVLLQSGGLVFIPTSASDLGRERWWKAVSNGQRLTDVTSVENTPYSLNLRPIAPVHARANRDTTNTVISWLRRTRLSTRFTGNLAPSAPLGEETESYEIEIYTTSGFSTVVRTLTSTTTSVTYTAAQQTTDFGSGQTVLYVRIYQLSAIVGRGTALQATI